MARTILPFGRRRCLSVPSASGFPVGRTANLLPLVHREMLLDVHLNFIGNPPFVRREFTIPLDLAMAVVSLLVLRRLSTIPFEFLWNRCE